MGNITVRRANVLLTVPDYQKEEYLTKGFDVVDNKGKVLEEATMTNDVSTLQKKLGQAHETIKQLEAEIARLNEELDEMAAQEDGDGEQQGLVDPEPSPKKKSSKKKTAKE